MQSHLHRRHAVEPSTDPCFRPHSSTQKMLCEAHYGRMRRPGSSRSMAFMSGHFLLSSSPAAPLRALHLWEISANRGLQATTQFRRRLAVRPVKFHLAAGCLTPTVLPTRRRIRASTRRRRDARTQKSGSKLFSCGWGVYSRRACSSPTLYTVLGVLL